MNSFLQSSPHKSILVLATNHVGNNLFLTPALHLLKKKCPGSAIDVVTMSPRGAAVFEGNPDVARVHTVYCRAQMRFLVRNYSAVIGLHHDIAGNMLRGLAAPAWIIGQDRRDLHRADEALEFVCGLLECDISDDDRRYMLCPRAAHAKRIDYLLREVPAGSLLVGFHLGSGRTAAHGWKFWYRGRDRDARLWPQEQYVALSQILARNNPRFRFVLTGARNDRFLGRRFARHVPQTINLIGETTLLDLAALMRRLRAFVTQDTGALHVACASDVPLIGLFGPTDPCRTGPYPLHPWHTTIKKSVMSDITPEEAAAAVLNATVLA